MNNRINSKTESKDQHRNKLGYIDPTVAGVDIGDKEIFVSIPDGKGQVIIKSYKTTTPQLHRIGEDLRKAGVKTAVMEATGVYWVPLYEILEEKGFRSVLVDAKSVKNIPGRKTDVLDCQWIQVLYSNEIVRPAYRPRKDRLALRGYVRWRNSIIKTKQTALLHMEKSLQLMNIKLSSAVSDIASISGIKIIRAIVAGEMEPSYLASLRDRGCKKEESFFIEALTGNYQKEHLFALEQSLKQFDFSDQQLAECDERILGELERLPNVVETLPPRRDKDKKKNGYYASKAKPRKNQLHFDVQKILWQKTGIDMTAIIGFGDLTALCVFAELGGTDVSAWRNCKAFGSWLKLCPGNNISGGKRRKSKSQPCANYISQALRLAAVAAKRTQSYMGAYIRRITGRTDKSKGIKAGAHKLSYLLYNMCKNGWEYHDKGENYYEIKQREKAEKNLLRRAKEMGFELVQKTA